MSPHDNEVEIAARAIVNNVRDELLDIETLSLETDPVIINNLVEAKLKKGGSNLLSTSVIASGERKDEVSWNFATMVIPAPEWTDHVLSLSRRWRAERPTLTPIQVQI